MTECVTTCNEKEFDWSDVARTRPCDRDGCTWEVDLADDDGNPDGVGRLVEDWGGEPALSLEVPYFATSQPHEYFVRLDWTDAYTAVLVDIDGAPGLSGCMDPHALPFYHCDWEGTLYFTD